jgi:ribose-phosphate pyrophosphokinase
MSCKLLDGRFESKVWAGGEVHVRVLEHEGIQALVTAILHNSQDIMEMLLLCDALKALGKEIWLTIPYLPYARQDRRCKIGEAFSLKLMADLINSIEANTVSLYDVHSIVAQALIYNCSNHTAHDLIGDSDIYKDKLLVCPDAGAEKRVLEFQKPYIMATKVRDPLTGDIIDTRVQTTDLAGKDCIVIDDICDGGRTFIALAKALQEKNCGELSLYVTHGIFSQGSENLKKYYKHIYCYDYEKGTIRCM